MNRSSPTSMVSDVAYTALVVLAAATAAATLPATPLVIIALALAVSPWVLLLAVRAVPAWVIVTVTVVAAAPVSAATGVSSALFLPIAAASYLAVRSDARALTAVAALVAIALPYLPLAFGLPWDAGYLYFSIGGVFALLVGLLVRHSMRLTERLRAAHRELTAAAAREERQRLARDVHDVVAHSLTVVVLNIAGARRVLRQTPDVADHALAQAEEVCRESLESIREVVGQLRTREALGQSPDLGSLIETYRTAGLAIDADIASGEWHLAPEVRTVMFRVVQEALANAGRHAARTAPVQITSTRRDGEVAVSVSNPASVGARGTASGFGLVGLAEQVASVGGTFSAGMRGEIWTVEARLPEQLVGVAESHE